MTDPVEAAKEEAARLVETARLLVATAGKEAEAIVARGHERVAAIVRDAEALRAAAETEAQEIRRQAEYSAATSGPAREATPGARPGHGPEDAIEEASAVADRILRVARSEAEARSREMIDAAKRKADQISTDAKTRADHDLRQHRDNMHRLQEREVETRARLREIESRLELAERRLRRTNDDVAETMDVVRPDTAEMEQDLDERVVLSSGIEFPKQPSPSGEPAQTTGQRPKASPGPSPSPPSVSDDPDVERALRAIRRRA